MTHQFLTHAIHLKVANLALDTFVVRDALVGQGVTAYRQFVIEATVITRTVGRSFMASITVPIEAHDNVLGCRLYGSTQPETGRNATEDELIHINSWTTDTDHSFGGRDGTSR